MGMWMHQMSMSEMWMDENGGIVNFSEFQDFD